MRNREIRHFLRRAVAAVFLIAGTVTLPGCGGGGGGTSPSTLPPAPVRRQVASFNFLTKETFDLARGEFTTSAAGTLEATCDWTFAVNDIDIGVYRNSCSFTQFLAQGCTVVTESVSTTAKPERVSASNAPAGSYTLIISSIGNTAESGTCQIFLTS